MKPRAVLTLVLLGVCCFAMATDLDSWFRAWNAQRSGSASVLEKLIGDSRRLFANHLFAKADAYFHGGYYPTIFDAPKSGGQSHLETVMKQGGDGKAKSHEKNESEDEGSFLGPSRDWIERFGRNFFPVTHSHLEKNGDERELLPWFRLAAEMDPQQADTYVSAAFWLRNRLGKVDEAEKFLREGLRQNPESCEILLELGRIAFENRANPAQARNLWELALQKWHRQEAAGLHPDQFVCEQVLGHLMQLEERQSHWNQVLVYLEELKNISPQRELIEHHIETVKAKIAAAAK